MNRDSLKIISEKYHAVVHISVSVLVWYIYGGDVSLLWMFLVAGYLPDIDHLFFIYGYGRSTNYAQDIRKLIASRSLGGVNKYILKHHKENTGIRSHNLYLVGALLVLSVGLLSVGQILWSGLFMSMVGHFVYDILEDLLFFGKLNGNWWLRFDKH
jgi:hypothetical protein